TELERTLIDVQVTGKLLPARNALRDFYKNLKVHLVAWDLYLALLKVEVLTQGIALVHGSTTAFQIRTMIAQVVEIFLRHQNRNADLPLGEGTLTTFITHLDHGLVHSMIVLKDILDYAREEVSQNTEEAPNLRLNALIAGGLLHDIFAAVPKKRSIHNILAGTLVRYLMVTVHAEKYTAEDAAQAQDAVINHRDHHKNESIIARIMVDADEKNAVDRLHLLMRANFR